METQVIERPVSDRRYKMRVFQSEFVSEFGGRIAAGQVVSVDQETALRWLENGIAEQAPDNAKTMREEKREALLRQLEALDRDGPPQGVYNAAITRNSFRDDNPAVVENGPRPMPKRGRRGAALRPNLNDVDVVNAERSFDDEGDE